jgi:hypothetical protein
MTFRRLLAVSGIIAVNVGCGVQQPVDFARGAERTSRQELLRGQPPIVASAGDIACAPNDPSFDGGSGNATNCHMAATAQLVADMNPTAVFPLGDNQYEDATLAEFHASWELSWGQFNNITRPVIGNHEYQTPDAVDHFTYFGAAAGDPSEGYFSFDVGTWHFIALNSNCNEIGGCAAGSAQETWLREDLAANAGRCIIAGWHHPLFSTRGPATEPQMHDIYQDLDDYGASLILVGHTHFYERYAHQTADGVLNPSSPRQIIVGNGGKSLQTRGATVQPNLEVCNYQTYGVLKLTLNARSVDWELVPETGESFTDFGTERCP